MRFAKTLVASLLIAAGAAQAAPVNTGFETGDLTGWTSNLIGGSAFVTTFDSGYTAVEGARFLVVGAGSANVWQTVSQTVSLQAGDELSGKAAFNWEDYNPFLDGAMVQILDAAGAVVATPFFMDGNGHSDYFNSPWTAWSFTAGTTASYTLVYGARNTGDSSMASFGYFDAATVTSKVPEPMSLGLVALGLLGAGAARRKARKA